MKENVEIRGMPFSSTTCTILSNVLLSRLTPYAEEITEDHPRGFRRNRPTNDHIFCTRHIFEKKWEYNKAVHHLFMGFETAYDSDRREAVCNILIEFGYPSDCAVTLKKCLNEIYSTAWTRKYLGDTFPINNSLKQGDALWSLLFSNLL